MNAERLEELREQINNEQEELRYWIEANQRQSDAHRSSQIDFFRNKIEILERQYVELMWVGKIPEDYVRSLGQVMWGLVGQRLLASEVVRVNEHVQAMLGNDLNSLTQMQYECFAACVLPAYGQYLKTSGYYENRYIKVDSSGRIIEKNVF